MLVHERFSVGFVPTCSLSLYLNLLKFFKTNKGKKVRPRSASFCFSAFRDITCVKSIYRVCLKLS